ncbi:MAG TPA: META domain-containing protein [Vicinamibacterales bacterium]
MRTLCPASRAVVIPFLCALALSCAPSLATQADTRGLGGTSWQLVQIQSMDGKTSTPDDRAKYTMAFSADGRVAMRIDCNRGSGTWKSAGPSQLEFGPLATTRAACPPGSLHDRIVTDLAYVRSYILKGGHLYLSLMADGGIYEFEPVPGG